MREREKEIVNMGRTLKYKVETEYNRMQGRENSGI